MIDDPEQPVWFNQLNEHSPAIDWGRELVALLDANNRLSDALRICQEQLRTAQERIEQAFIDRLLHHLNRRGIDTSGWDGEDDPAEIIAAEWADQLNGANK